MILLQLDCPNNQPSAALALKLKAVKKWEHEFQLSELTDTSDQHRPGSLRAIRRSTRGQPEKEQDDVVPSDLWPSSAPEAKKRSESQKELVGFCVFKLWTFPTDAANRYESDSSKHHVELETMVLVDYLYLKRLREMIMLKRVMLLNNWILDFLVLVIWGEMCQWWTRRLRREELYSAREVLKVQLLPSPALYSSFSSCS